MGQFVFGVEGDWDWANLANTQTKPLVSNHMDINQILTARARAGVAFDRALVFVTGGYAGVGTNASFAVFSGFGGSQNTWVSGGAIGGGVEYAFTNNVTAKVEYLYLPLSSTTHLRLDGLVGARAGRRQPAPRRPQHQVLSVWSAADLIRRRGRRASGPRTGRAGRQGANGAPLSPKFTPI